MDLITHTPRLLHRSIHVSGRKKKRSSKGKDSRSSLSHSVIIDNYYIPSRSWVCVVRPEPSVLFGRTECRSSCTSRLHPCFGKIMGQYFSPILHATRTII